MTFILKFVAKNVREYELCSYESVCVKILDQGKNYKKPLISEMIHIEEKKNEIKIDTRYGVIT